MNSQSIDAGKTPRYVLLRSLTRASPTMVPDLMPEGTTVIYGFSDELPYREFQSHSEVKFTPYPLVRQFLEDQLNDDSEHLHLIVLDAAGPNDPVIGAATIPEILASFREQSATIPFSHVFEWDAVKQAYAPGKLAG